MNRWIAITNQIDQGLDGFGRVTARQKVAYSIGPRVRLARRV
jgi:hypothetical protein